MAIQLRMNAAHEAAMRRHGEGTYPHECCGFLVGRHGDEAKIVERVVPAGNQRDDSPRNRYLIDPAEFVRVQREATADDLDVLGFYHSHPDAAARPSQFDRDHAWPWYSYVILSVKSGHSEELFSWVVREEDAPFEEEAYEIDP